MTSAPAQRRLPIKVEIATPLMSIGAARAVLELDEDEMLDLIDNNLLAWAWHIESAPGGRREIRILAKCVRGFQTTQTDCGLRHASVEEIIGHILARDKKPFIDGRRLASLFVCSGQLVMDLISAGALTVTEGTSWRRGRGGSPVISRESVVRFLQERRIS